MERGSDRHRDVGKRRTSEEKGCRAAVLQLVGKTAGLQSGLPTLRCEEQLHRDELIAAMRQQLPA